MNEEENDFFERCFGIVAGLEVGNEAQAIAKEVVLDEVENLQQENKQLKHILDELEKETEEAIRVGHNRYYQYVTDIHELANDFELNEYINYLAYTIIEDKLKELRGRENE